MAQLKKKFVKNDAIDGLKLLLLNNQPVRALNASGSAEELMKLDADGVMQLLKLPKVPASPTVDEHVSNKAYVDSQVSSEASSRASAISAVETAYQSADDAIEGRLDIIEGADNVEGSVAKAEKDAKDYADAQISALINGAPGVLDTLKELADALGGDENFATTIAGQISSLDGRLDTVEGGELVSGSLLNILKQAKDYADSINGGSVADLEAAIEAEETARIAGDDALDARLDVIEGADTVVGSVAKALKDAKDYTDAEVAQEVSDRQAAVSAEQSARETADNDLDARLDIIEGADSVEGSVAKAEKDAKDYADGIVATEQSAREFADSALDGRLDILEGSSSTVGSVAKAEADAKAYADGIVATEQTARESADDALDARLDILEGADNVEGSVAKAEKDAKDYADAQITALINGAPGVLDTLKELADALGGDENFATTISTQLSSLDGRLDTLEGGELVSGSILNILKQAKDYTDTRETAITTAYQSADSALDGRLDVLEGADTVEGSVAKAEKDAKDYTDSEIAALTTDDIEEGSTNLYFEEGRAQTAAVVNVMTGGETVKAPSVSSVKTYIDGEVSDLQDQIDDSNAAITDLQSDVSDLQAKVFNKEVKTLSAQNITDGYVDLAFTVESNSLFVFTNSLFLGESEDYSLSVVGGVTRVTWLNGFSSGGATEFEAGEKVFFQYRK